MQRHEALSRARHFIKVHKETANMTVAELKAKAKMDRDWLTKNCERFLQDMVGSKAYWKFHVRNRFNALINGFSKIWEIP